MNPGDITQLLHDWKEGDRHAFDQLVPMLYDDLRRIARRHLARHRPGQTLNTTGLVHELYLKMADHGKVSWQDRSHFLAISARAMRQVIVAYARKRMAAKRGGGEKPVTLDEARLAIDSQAESLLTLDQALTRLSEWNERLAQVVECRFFAGMTDEETSQVLGTSLRTAQRDWKRARAWLREEMRTTSPSDTGGGGA